MGETELAARLAAMVGCGLLCLGGIVWRDAARYDDGWLILAGYGLAVCSGLGFWDRNWLAATAVFAAVYRWRRNWIREE